MFVVFSARDLNVHTSINSRARNLHLARKSSPARRYELTIVPPPVDFISGVVSSVQSLNTGSEPMWRTSAILRAAEHRRATGRLRRLVHAANLS